MKTKLYLRLSSACAAVGATLLLCAAFLGGGCSTVTHEESVSTRRVISEEPLVGQPAPPAPPVAKP